MFDPPNGGGMISPEASAIAFFEGAHRDRKIGRNPTVAPESGIADLVGSLFQSSYGRGERTIHRRRSLHGRDVFGAPGEVLGSETGRRLRQSRQSDRPGARAGRVELIGVTVPGSSPMMVARGSGESAMDPLSAFRARDRAGASPV